MQLSTILLLPLIAVAAAEPYVPQYNPGAGSKNNQGQPPSGLTGEDSPPAPPSEPTSAGGGGGWGWGVGPSGVFSGGPGAAPTGGVPPGGLSSIQIATATGWWGGSGSKATSAPGSGSGYAPFPMVSGLPMASGSAAGLGPSRASNSASGMASSYRPGASATGAAGSSTTSTVASSGASPALGTSSWRAGSCALAMTLAGVGAGFVLLL